MDEMAAPEPVHDLLLRLAGRVDDDLLEDARELVAVGEDGRALELVTAALAADATPLPAALRAALVEAAAEARIDLDADAALGPEGDASDEHRFTAEAGPVDGVQEALSALPARRFEGCELRVSWRVTPAGAASGPLPRAVVLVRAGGHAPPDVLAYQMTTALARRGVRASVEVLAGGGPVPRYHAAAWRESAPLTLLTPDPSTADGPGPDEPADRNADDRNADDRNADDDRGGVAGNGQGSFSAGVPETEGRGAGSDRAGTDGWTNGRSSWADDRTPFGGGPDAAAPVGLFDDGADRSARDRGGRRPEAGSWGAAPAGDDGGPAAGDDGNGHRWVTPRGAGAPLRNGSLDDLATEPGGREPAPRPLPMRPPGGRRRLVEQPGDDHLGVTPLGRGPVQGPVPIDRRRPSPRPVALPQVVDPSEGSVPRPSRPDAAELTDTPTFAATHDALLGSRTDPPLEDPDDAATRPAQHRGPSSRSGGAGPARPGSAGPSRAAAGGPRQTPPRAGTSHAAAAQPAPAAAVDDERAWAGEWTSGNWAVAEPGSGQRVDPTPPGGATPSQDAGLLRPETVTRLSDADRDLLARLQAELVAGRRPRTGHEADGPGTNGAHADPSRDQDTR